MIWNFYYFTILVKLHREVGVVVEKLGKIEDNLFLVSFEQYKSKNKIRKKLQKIRFKNN